MLTGGFGCGNIPFVNKAEATASHLLIRSDGFDTVIFVKGGIVSPFIFVIKIKRRRCFLLVRKLRESTKKSGFVAEKSA